MKAFIQTLGYWLIQAAPYAVAIMLGIVLGAMQ
jgi:hypothetical protein